ncbi:MAG: MHYT domain-containing protein [Thermomicrobiales bacterium]
MNHPLDLYSNYNYALILLALFVGSCASFCALELVAYITSQRGAARRAWLLGGASVFGLGVWATHFIGMLAFSLTTPVGYYLPIVVVSMAPAIAAAALALALTTSGPLTAGRLWGGAVLMGAGIGAMHYSGMFAMRMAAVTYYDLAYLLGSVVFAVAASLLSLYMAFSLRDEEADSANRAIAGLVMGTAIAGLHFTAMFFASHFAPATATGRLLTTPWTNAAPSGAWVVQIPPAVAVLIAILLLGGVAYVLGRMRAAQAVARRLAATKVAPSAPDSRGSTLIGRNGL